MTIAGSTPVTRSGKRTYATGGGTNDADGVDAGVADAGAPTDSVDVGVVDAVPEVDRLAVAVVEPLRVGKSECDAAPLCVGAAREAERLAPLTVALVLTLAAPLLEGDADAEALPEPEDDPEDVPEAEDEGELVAVAVAVPERCAGSLRGREEVLPLSLADAVTEPEPEPEDDIDAEGDADVDPEEEDVNVEEAETVRLPLCETERLTSALREPEYVADTVANSVAAAEALPLDETVLLPEVVSVAGAVTNAEAARLPVASAVPEGDDEAELLAVEEDDEELEAEGEPDAEGEPVALLLALCVAAKE
jgi:hypothetical protein